MNDHLRWRTTLLPIVTLTLFSLGPISSALSAPVPGGTLNPLSIPKYVTPLVIPPEMPKSVTSPAPVADYDIAVRQFKQQILPGGIWGSSFPNPLGAGTVGALPATTVWSYGRAADPLPNSTAIPGGGAGIAPATNSSFNYPAFTVEATSALLTKVRWINDLKNPTSGAFLPHLFSVDQTIHWANPPTANCVVLPANRTDCLTAVSGPYTGPVPLVPHLHGAHVQHHSDGYPQAWWLPAANNIPAGYSLTGTNYTQADNTNAVAGSAFYSYENTQAATTLWYHDHALGMTRLNVYAGPAGFWLIRGGANDLAAGILPGPAPTAAGGDPNFTPAVRNAIREIPLAIQDRSFNVDGSLFYPNNRTFFDGFTGPFIGGTGTPAGPSDIHGIWNPEAFFNTMVVNGTTWPKLDVAPARYRLRLLDGCNSRTLNLSMFVVSSLGADGKPGTADDILGAELPFYQIGAEQGFLPKVVKIQTGIITTLPGNGTVPAPVAAPDPSQALLLMPAERADVIVDFSGLPNGTRIRMINTGPDVPFGGFPIPPLDKSDTLTTGQVMEFIVNSALTKAADATTTLPQNLVLPVQAPLPAATNTRKLSLNEMSSEQVCVEVNAVTGAIVGTLFSTTAGDPTFLARCAAAVVAAGNMPAPMGPREALLGVLTADALGNLTAVPKMWRDAITETPALNTTEIWEIYNTTVDAHPVHVHLVGFEVVNRQALDPAALLLGNLVPTGVPSAPHPNELGLKDTVIALPGQVTRIKATFDIAGLYVWHCHIVEHEDNEMMRPFKVSVPAKAGVFRDGQLYRDMNGNGAWDPATDSLTWFGIAGDIPIVGDWNGTGIFKIGVFRNGQVYRDMNGNGSWDGATDAFTWFGIAGDIPVAGDWNGAGTSKIGVFRNGQWYLDINANGTWEAGGDAAHSFGIANDIPVTGDWDGTGTTKVGVVRTSGGVLEWYLDMNGNGAWDQGIDKVYVYGVAGDTPVTGDLTGTGITRIGVFKNGLWTLDTNGSGINDIGDYQTSFGIMGDKPIPGKW